MSKAKLLPLADYTGATVEVRPNPAFEEETQILVNGVVVAFFRDGVLELEAVTEYREELEPFVRLDVTEEATFIRVNK